MYPFLTIAVILTFFRYYSNYNSENIDPFVSSPSRSDLGLHSSSSNSIKSSISLAAASVIAAIITGKILR